MPAQAAPLAYVPVQPAVRMYVPAEQSVRNYVPAIKETNRKIQVERYYYLPSLDADPPTTEKKSTATQKPSEPVQPVLWPASTIIREYYYFSGNEKSDPEAPKPAPKKFVMPEPKEAIGDKANPDQ